MKLKYIFQLFLELFIFIFYPVTVLILFLKILKPFEKAKKGKYKGDPIVIFEHWWTKIYYRVLMKNYLEKRGVKVYWLNYSLFKGGMEEAAVYLKQFILKNKIKNAVLVGVSIGAVSAYEYLQRHDGWKYFKKFIPIGGPFHGTPVAYIGIPLKGARQIFPNSSYLKKLLNEKAKYPGKILTISAKIDEIVPAQSSRLPFVRQKVIDTAGHNVLHIFSKELFEIVAQSAKK
jgi:hypothetical protein